MVKKGRDANVVQLVSRTIQIAVWVVLFMATLSMLKVPISSLAFLSGAVAIGVGFGAQNIINNFISGWILMGEQPIRIGDLLEIDQTLGVVVAINFRSTLIKRIDGVHIVIPNSQILEQQVVNWTLVDREVRTQVRVGVAYGSPAREVERLIHQAVREQKDVLDTPATVVIFEDFGDNALVFDAFFWTLLRPGGDLRQLRSAVRFRIEELFREHGIVVAFPQRDVHLDGTLQLVRSAADPAPGGDP
jgi:small-conductance mechanosensitive channel